MAILTTAAVVNHHRMTRRRMQERREHNDSDDENDRHENRVLQAGNLRSPDCGKDLETRAKKRSIGGGSNYIRTCNVTPPL